MNKYGIAIHGGAGMISKAKIPTAKIEESIQALKDAYNAGYKILDEGGTSVEAVKAAIIILEDDPIFNAGRGSVYTNQGDVEMDASIMDGQKMEAGAVASVSFVKNPIVLADTVMKKSKHVLISGDKALEYAKECGLEIESKSYFESEERYEQYLEALENNTFALDHDDEENKKFGTVGAVALDQNGNLAAGTSTGGMVNKRYGRIGDSPLIGIGTYANNETCAISCTGHGEFFIRSVVAHEVSARIKYKGETVIEAANDLILNELKNKGGKGGLIGIDKGCNIVLPFNTSGMYRGFKKSDGEEFVGIF